MSVLHGWKIPISIGLLLIGSLSYCGFSIHESMKPEMALMEKASIAWSEKYNAAQFDDCYAMAGSAIRSAVTKEKFSSQMEGLLKAYGEITLLSQISFEITPGKQKRKVVTQWDAASSRGHMLACFTFYENNGWEIGGFLLVNR